MEISKVAIAVAVVIEENQEVFELKQQFAKRKEPKTGFIGKLISKCSIVSKFFKLNKNSRSGGQ